MFVLKARDGKLFYLSELKEYTVGRKECDLLIAGDQSISRLHAKLFLRNKKPVVIDTGSRYGTFINKVQLTPKTEVEVSDGADIRFGQLRAYYKMERITIITTSSTIKGDQKRILLNNINFLGGSLLQNWTAQCTHLTVEEILLTVKVLCAVIKGIPIVTPKYWEDYVANVNNNLPPPDVNNYRPVCSEVTLNKNVTFDYKPERLHLFKNKVFVFPTKNDRVKMADLIKLAGGDAISWDVNPLTTKDLSSSETEYVILEMGTSLSENIEPSMSAIIQYNAELGKRTIPIQEIALAVINCSCEKDCNPSFDRKGTVFALKTQRLATQHTDNVLVLSTQTQNLDPVDEFKSQEIIQDTDEIQIIENKVPQVIDIEDTSNSSKLSMEAEQTTSTSVKRDNEAGGEDLVSAPKRVKLESAVNKNNIIQPGPSGIVTEPLGKGKFAFKRDENISNEQPKQESSNPFILKRKTREADVVDNPAKRNATTSADVSLSSKLVNPFSLIRIKTPASVSKDISVQNTSTSIISSKLEQNVSHTFVNGDITYNIQLDSSAIVPVDKKMEKSCSWVSTNSKPKPTKDLETVGTRVVTPHRTESDEVDDGFLKYVESFRNLIIVEPITVRRSLTISNDSGGAATSPNGKNFKKFKKVQPLKVQTTIIPESSYIQVVCNERGGIPLQPEESDDENETGLRIQQQRRFVF